MKRHGTRADQVNAQSSDGSGLVMANPPLMRTPLTTLGLNPQRRSTWQLRQSGRLRRKSRRRVELRRQGSQNSFNGLEFVRSASGDQQFGFLVETNIELSFAAEFLAEHSKPPPSTGH